jgi:hypothetical protein
VAGGWRKLHNDELHNCILRLVQYEEVKEEEMGRACRTNRGEE